MTSSPRSSFLLWSALVTLSAVMLGGCASSQMSRIDADRDKYESWPLEVREAVLNKRAVKGMTEDQVTMAMGKPSTVEHRNGKAGDDEEVWVYKSGGGGLLGGGGPSIDVGTGTSIGGVGIYASKNVASGGQRMSNQDEVVFTNGVVTGTDIGAR